LYNWNDQVVENEMGGPCNSKKGEYEGVKVVGKKARGKETTRKIKGTGGWIILSCILERWDGVMWTGLVWLRIGTGGERL
jgi:hypothetical protein